MSHPGDESAAHFFQALGDPTRLALLSELRAGERNVTELVDALGCPQPKVSRHLKVLKDAGLVRDRRDGRHVGYALSTSKAWPVAARAWLEAFEMGLPLREVRAPEAESRRTEPARRDTSPRERDVGRAPARRDVEAHLL